MKKLNNTLIIVGGIILVLLGLFHLSFWLNPLWNSELSKLTQEISALVQMLNLGLIALLLLLGATLIYCRREIRNTRLGKMLLVTVSLFLIVRLIAEFIFPNSSIIMGIILFLCVLIYLIPIFTLDTEF